MSRGVGRRDRRKTRCRCHRCAASVSDAFKARIRGTTALHANSGMSADACDGAQLYGLAFLGYTACGIHSCAYQERRPLRLNGKSDEQCGKENRRRATKLASPPSLSRYPQASAATSVSSLGAVGATSHDSYFATKPPKCWTVSATGSVGRMGPEDLREVIPA